MTTVFETEECSRCGGTGRFSHNGEHDRCYKCDGKNGCKAYTKRGAAAKAYFDSLFTMNAADVKIGDVIRFSGVKQLTVATITRKYSGIGRSGKWCREVGGMVHREFEIWHFIFENANGLKGSVQDYEGATVQRVPTFEQREEMIAKALAYQATLTKAGTVRKTKGTN